MQKEIVSTEVAGNLKVELAKKTGKQYQSILQAAQNITFSKDTLDADFTPLKQLREAVGALNEMENPYTAKWQEWNKARKSLVDPLANELAVKTEQFTKLAKELKEENEKKEADRQRVENIRTVITDFSVDFSGKIAACDNIAALTALQMRLGAEKSRKSFYQELMPDFLEVCKSLENGLSTQKQKLRELGVLEEKEKTADDETLIEIIGKKEEITAQIEESKIMVQENVLKSATSAPQYVVAEKTGSVPRPRRTTWKFKVQDEAKAFKAGMLTTEVNTTKAKQVLATLKETKKTEEESSIIVNGILYYEDSSY